ncbi:unnamed protein product [Rotaria sp. Silwood1]|nr:unnamed protein product [Rotaria sp. Silwood1]
MNIDTNSGTDSQSTNDVIEQRIKKLTDEKNTILAVCSKLAHFLQSNSLNPVNDDIMDYIQHFIREERTKNSNGAQNNDIIDGLEKLVIDYRNEIDLLQSLIKTNETNPSKLTSIIQSKEIFDHVRTLYQLPIYGVKIRQQVEQVKHVQLRARGDREHIIELPATAETSITMIGLRKILG